jgi:hypothetical protein
MTENNISKLFVAVLIVAIIAVSALIFVNSKPSETSPTVAPDSQPKRRSRRLTEQERRDSVNPKKKIAEG